MLTYLLVRLADAYSMIIFIYVMMSWLPNTQSGIIGDIYRALGKLCDPYLNLFRKLIPPLGGMVDVTPISACITIRGTFAGDDFLNSDGRHSDVSAT